MSPFLILIFIPAILVNGREFKENFDYCEMLGEDDIQGKKHGFLAGNKVYYIGGKYFSQKLGENETIGLTHPFYHDLRSRGTGIAYHEGKFYILFIRVTNIPYSCEQKHVSLFQKSNI